MLIMHKSSDSLIMIMWLPLALVVNSILRYDFRYMNNPFDHACIKLAFDLMLPGFAVGISSILMSFSLVRFFCYELSRQMYTFSSF